VLVVRGVRRAIWNTDTGKVVELRGGILGVPAPLWPCGHAAGCAPWSPDGRLVAGANTNGGAVVWNARTGHVARTFGKETRTVIEAAFSPDGRFLVVVDVNRRRARIWDVLKRKPEEQVPARHDARHVLNSAQFVANPLRVLTVDEVQNVQLSTPATGETRALPGAALPAAVAAARDGAQIALGTTHGELQVFSPAGGAPRERHVTDRPVNSLEFNRDGTTIATSQNGTAATWDTRTLKPTRLRAVGGKISGATFSPDGDLLLVTSEAAARLWDWRLRRVVVELPRTAAVRGEFSPSGSQIVIAGKTRLEVVACYACLPLKKLEKRVRALLPAS
jgi:WD40 repeat protein